MGLNIGHRLWLMQLAILHLLLLILHPDSAGAANYPPTLNTCTNLNTTYVTFKDREITAFCSPSSAFLIQLKEEIPSGVPLVQMTATDPDNDPVTMTLTGAGLATHYFSLQSSPPSRSAILKSNSRLDIDTMKEITITLKIQLDDEHSNVLTSDFNLVIVVDINDNAPEFQGLPYRWEIPENEPPSGNLTFPITAVDKDRNAGAASLVFKEVSGAVITGVFNFSELNTTGYCQPGTDYCNGNLYYRIISLLRPLDYEANRFYQISVNATDLTPGGVSTHTDVIINVLDRQDTPPFFQGIPYLKTVPENSPNGTHVLKVFAEDGDRGEPNPIAYQLDASSPFSKYFRLDNATGDLTLGSIALDRESAEIQAVFGTFDLPVVAIEVSSTPQPANISQATATVRIVVEDQNDFAPKFNYLVYNGSVMENTMTDVPVTLSSVMSAADYDTGVNGEFNLTVMKDGQPYANFDVTPSIVSREATLIVRVKNTTLLDYEVLKDVTFEVVARETRSVEKSSSTATVQLQILDANDNRPAFNQTTYAFAIPENSPKNTYVGRVWATDADSGTFGTVTYILEGSDSSKFAINSTTGEIVVNVDADRNGTLLDRERFSTVYLTVLGRDGGGFITSVLLEITLTDTNDQVPQFTRTQYSGYVRENTMSFESPVQVQAVDEDQKGSNNALVQYKILDGGLSGHFNVVSTTGLLDIQTPLDFEALTVPIINLTVVAYDAGLPSLNSSVTVLVTVLDQNDNSPACTQPVFVSSVAENATSSTPVAQVNATDIDAAGTDASRIFYRIQSGAADKFAMNGDTGWLSVERGADLDVNKYGSSYNLTVAVFDMGSPQRSGICSVAITVRDINNQRPYFDTPSRRETFPENQTVGAALPISPPYTAKDPDSSARLQYSLLYDQMSASEANGRPVDVNVYNFTDLLEISETNGTLYVKRPLDREKVQEIYVPIFVRDLAAETVLPVQTATGTLILTLSDVNDEWPMFLPPAVNNTYRVNISEGLVPPVEIGLTAMAVDLDSTNPSLVYSIVATTLFMVKSDTGQLGLIQPLDRETLDNHTFYVLANDSIHVTTATVYVTVTDVNDVAPTFYQFAASLNVSEGTAVGTVLTTVLAADNDTGAFGTVNYRILSGNDGRFHLNDTTGELRLSLPLDRDISGGDAYSLLIEAFDNPGSGDSQRSSRHLAITVLDVNDNAPRFAQSNYTITSLLESMDADQFIREIPAVDIDAGVNSHMNFSFAAIPGQSAQALSLFQVVTLRSGSSFAAAIGTRRSLTAAVGWYNVTLLATDFGSPQQTGSTNVTFFIADVNDHNPEFVYPNTSNTVLQVNESVNGSSTIGKSLIQVFATDRDYGNNSIIRFDLTSSSGDHAAFSVDSVSGLITVAIHLDREVKAEYRFQVRARDLGSPPLTSMVNLIVQVLDIDEGPPSFTSGSRVQSFSVPENSAPSGPVPGLNVTGVYIGSVARAQDPDDTSRHDAVCYFILDRVYDTFYMNKSGSLYALKSFNRESVAQYTLHIIAVGPTDCVSNKYQWRNAPAMSSRRRRYLDDTPVVYDPANPAMAQLVVVVGDVNDNPPVWTAPIYFGGVNVNDPPATSVFNFADFVTDPDVGNNSALTYGITQVLASTSQLTAQLQERGIYTEVFVIDNRTGLLKTGPRTYFQDSMSGSLHFNVTATDSSFTATAACTIYLLSLDQQLIITVADVPANVTRFRDAFIDYLSNITGWRVVVDSIVTHRNDDGSADPTKSDVYFHAIDTSDNSIVPAITVQRKIDLLSTEMIKLYRDFRVLWVKLARQAPATDSTLQILRIALIAVACGLTVLLFFSCISLWTCRRMYRRKLKAATTVAFGSSGQTMTGLKTPGTNMHAFEGSNPIWMKGSAEPAQYDNRAYDSDKDSIDNNQVNLASPPRGGVAHPQIQAANFDEMEKSMGFAQDNASDEAGSVRQLVAEESKILDTAVDAGPTFASLGRPNGTASRSGGGGSGVNGGPPPASVMNQPTAHL